MKDRGIEPTFFTISVRVNVYVKDFLGVHARPCVSQVKWQENLGKERSATK